ncbi:MAG: ChbG/HpnK family deacetylase [Bulleidia sp.]
MITLLIRADDIGYCDGVNRGIVDVVKAGLVRSAGLMPNMEKAQAGFDQLKDLPVCIGQHTNLCLGIPCCHPEEIPSLVNPDGTFLSSRVFRQAAGEGRDIVALEDAVKEVDAQYHRFMEITGRQPAYFEAHAIASDNIARALAMIAKRYGLPYSDMIPGRKEGTFCGKPVMQCEMRSMCEDYDPFDTLIHAVENADETVPNVFVTHPGYVDADLLNSSSLTYNREKEVHVLLDPAVKQWLEAHHVHLVGYENIR